MISQKSSTESNRKGTKPFWFTLLNSLKSIAVAPATINIVVFFIISVVLSASELIGNETFTDPETGDVIIRKACEGYEYLILSNNAIFAVPLQICAVITAIITAIFSFKFITSKKTVNVYYSLGISRDKLFLAKYIAGAISLCISIIIPFLITMAVNVATIGYNEALGNAILFYIFSYIALSLIAYSITAAAFSAVGTSFEAVIFGGVILLSPTFIISCLEALMDKFLLGTPYGYSFNLEGIADSYSLTSESLTMRFSWLNPILFDSEQLAYWGVREVDKALTWHPSLIYAIAWTLISVMVMFVGMYIFQKRKAEVCGFIGTNKVMNSFATLIIGFYVLCSVINTLPLSGFAAIAVGFVGFALTYIVLELLLLRDIKAFARGLFKLPIEIAAAVVVITLFYTGLFGYSAKMPELTEISSAAVTYLGSGTEYGIFSNDNWGALGTAECQYNSGTSLVDGFSSEEDLKLVLSLHQKMITQGRLSESDENAQALPVQFAYKLKDGSMLLRNYTMVTDTIISDFLKVEDSDLFKDRLKTVFTDSITTKPGDITDPYGANSQELIEFAKYALRSGDNDISLISKFADSTLNTSLTMAQKARLARCIYTDLLERTAEEKYHPESPVLGIIRFNGEGFYAAPMPDGDIEQTTEDESISETDTSESETLSETVSESLSESETVTMSPDFSILYSKLYEELYGTTAQESTEPETQSETDTTAVTEPSTTQPVTPPSTSSTAPSPDGVAYTSGRGLIKKLSAVGSTGSTTPPSTTAPSTPVPGTTVPGTAAAPGVSDPSAPGNTEVTEPTTEPVANKIPVDAINSDLVGNSPYRYTVSIVLTSDMINTINFLKELGIYDSLVEQADFAMAEVVPVKAALTLRDYALSSAERQSRYFTGSCTRKQTTTGTDGPVYMSEFDMTFAELGLLYTTTVRSEVSAMLSSASLAYYNESLDGYYVRFTTRDKKIRTMLYLPADAIPASVKEQTDKIFVTPGEAIPDDGVVVTVVY